MSKQKKYDFLKYTESAFAGAGSGGERSGRYGLDKAHEYVESNGGGSCGQGSNLYIM